MVLCRALFPGERPSGSQPFTFAVPLLQSAWQREMKVVG